MRKGPELRLVANFLAARLVLLTHMLLVLPRCSAVLLLLLLLWMLWVLWVQVMLNELQMVV